MYVMNRSYRDISFPTSIGNVVIRGTKSNLLHLPEQKAYGLTLVDDAIWAEICEKWKHILAQGFIVADTKEREIKAKADDEIKKPLKVKPIEVK
jgi:hypothetical protein